MTDRFPSLESLRIFEASARHANFTRAAMELGVTPAAVSLRIRNLEIDLGTTLFDRNGPRIRLTGAGAELAARLGEVLASARSAVAACRATEVPLRLTVTPTFARRWLVPRLPAYQGQAGAAAIRLDVSSDLRAANHFDIAIRSGKGDWPGFASLELLPILRAPMMCPELADMISVPSDVLRFPLIRDANWQAWFGQAGVVATDPILSPVEYETQDMAAAAVTNGAGIALLSPQLFGDMLADGSLVQPFSQLLSSDEGYHVLWRQDDGRAEVGHFVQWLRTQAESAVIDPARRARLV